MDNKWQMNRAGLLNFWYYDEEVFEFADGKLLLRGSNGSGKSVTMQSFLPVLLDGKKSPDRLDPFGSKARKMEDYLLGEKEVVDRDERTGYLFLEFKKADNEQYMTIGIGLQAKRNKPMKFWGFVVTDNRRIGYDFDLYKYENNAGEKQKIPRSRIELENVIGDGGQVVQTQNEYMKLVNKYVFGFETMEAYEDLIKLLIQLRSPKLSKDFRPTVIYEILEAALPPLSDEDLRHLSDTIEQMDQTKQQIEQLEREVTAIRSLNHVYSTYNQRVLADQAREFLSASKRVEKEQQIYDQLVNENQNLENEITQLTEQINDLTIEQETYQKQKERLSSHKVWNLEKERSQEQEKFEQVSRDLSRKNEQLGQRQQKERQLLDQKNLLEGSVTDRRHAIDDMILDMENDAEEASFGQTHQLNRQDFERSAQDTFDFSVWQKETNSHLNDLEAIEVEMRQYESLKDKYQEKDKELAAETKQLDDVTYQEQEWSKLFEEDKAKKLDEIYNWLSDTPWLKVSEDAIQEASRAIGFLYEPNSFEQVKQPFRQAVFAFEQQKRQTLSQLEFDRNQVIAQIEEKQQDLQEWKMKKDPEPDIHPETKLARKQLTDNGVAYVPFYAAVEFQDHVELDVQKRIEAAVLDSGMLDALITEENVAIMHDRVFTPAPNMMAFTLADYLQPDVDDSSLISATAVDDVLRSIMIGEDEESSFSISETGNYSIGLMKGHAVPVDNVRYIGRTARKRFREEQIQLLQAEIESLQGDKKVITDEIDTVHDAITEANRRFSQFPNDTDLQESFHHIKQARFQIEQHKSRLQTLTAQLKEIHRQYSEIKASMDEKTRTFNIERKLPAYQAAIVVMKRYDKDLSDLEKQHIKYVHNITRLDDVTRQLEELMEGMDELKGEINVATDRIKAIQQNLEQIELQLEQQGVADIRKQIEEVQTKLKFLEANLTDKVTTKPRKETELSHVAEKVVAKQVEVDFWINMMDAWGQSFEKELARRFVDVEKEELTSTAQEVVKQYGDILKEKDGSKLLGQLTQEFYKQQTDLMEYRMNEFSVSVDVPDWMNNGVGEEELPHVEKWKGKATRRLIELDYQGKQVSPYTVQQQLELDQARQESLLDEQDKALYEEILFHSVGQKLRARIRRAEQWVNEMKHLMETRDTSSGLSFSIRWKPRTADTESELDTVDLVQLLRQDAKLLKEEDLEKITMHFRSKIAKAKDLIGSASETQTLLQVLKEVLDYRKWFSFVLYFRREGESRRELTNNQFYKFSGGEKAMAMYIPLFTACYSRYKEAEAHAPYIISLDEAFAGVDENNIREMFEIVEQLGFNYMMNSQVLWGDYDTISSLSICELVRPKNADFVSVIKYYWDGEKLAFETPIEQEDETLI
ncbi:TIGR02680 family protein [Aquibacillus salsiterrae]|uniref:TIGR02680 family protein n=1 Tax=Aquibacillus salsiterrae TaxID=2950439 RepID=A0A9X3WH15_9BACI|nr:TIGR02680 family protein [Aquibacillus salsiterrae]MDC3418473.1 TIGR02680 family protein [Aquibacillus salsiterrae]